MNVGPSDERVRTQLGSSGRRWYEIDAKDWQPMQIGGRILPGYFWIPIAEDEKGAWSSYWMRIDAGARSPEHRHESTELVMVLNGVFSDDDGTHFLPGQSVIYAAASRHSTWSEVGCTVLVVAQIGSSIVS